MRGSHHLIIEPEHAFYLIM